jgi:hypothetical protein
MNKILLCLNRVLLAGFQPAAASGAPTSCHKYCLHALNNTIKLRFPDFAVATGYTGEQPDVSSNASGSLSFTLILETRHKHIVDIDIDMYYGLVVTSALRLRACAMC